MKVTQTFHNPTKEKIEAVYVFPLPHEGAVDDMTMVIGERKIVGVIKKRAEARAIYDQALAQGQTAALLGAGTAQHFHAIGGQHRSRAGGEDRNLVRRCAAL